MITIITGATSGIGKATAFGLAEKGFELLLIGRNQEAGSNLVDSLVKKWGCNADFVKCDFASLAQVEELTQKIEKRYNTIDVLINNAGVSKSERGLTVDGYEATFAINHLAPFLLTNRLLPLLEKSAQGRIVNVASELHRRATIHFQDIMLEKGYSTLRAYNQSKLANIMFTYELARRLAESAITANCLHPGVVATSIGRDFSGFITGIINFFWLTPEKGAEPSIYLASASELSKVSGKYFNRLRETRSSATSYDTEKALRLWQVSEHLTKL